MLSKSMKYSYPSAATATQHVRVMIKIIFRNLWSGINAAMAAALFSAFTTPWTIATSWAVEFALCADPCVISSAWDDAA